MNPRISLDKSERSIVVTCSACPHWADVATTTTAAWRIAAEHEGAAHDGARRALDAYRKHLERNATRRELRDSRLVVHN